jgi:squalene synthase HpnC
MNELDPFELNNAYNRSINFTKAHYENFPVLSIFIPKEYQKYVAVFYQFARQADDIADEGDFSAEERLKLLDQYEKELTECLEGNFTNDFWMALNDTIKKKSITEDLLFSLLMAFKQDVYKNRYNHFEELLDYCKNSANPVGRFILELFNVRDPEIYEYSDAICTGLQLTNFYQDVTVDYAKNRVYLPLTEIEKFGVDESVIEQKTLNFNFQNFMKFQIKRTRDLFLKGRKLIPQLPRNLKYQITWTILGGEEILKKIEKIDYNVLNIRPKLSKIDYFRLLFRSFRGGI